MNQILEWLQGGDLRSDGLSSEVVSFVLANPGLVEELLEGLNAEDDLVRGRTADALEKIARQEPGLVEPSLARLMQAARNDPLPMVRMHIAMLLGHLAVYPQHAPKITQNLLGMLKDPSAFTRSWAIASLCIMGRKVPGDRARIVGAVARLKSDPSIAIRTRVRNALQVLTDGGAPFPKGWVKSRHLQDL